MMQNLEKEGCVKESHLDKLGAAELGHVLRHLSARPRHAHWQMKVSADDVSSVLKSGGPLAACARRKFSALCLHCTWEDIPALYVDQHRPDAAQFFEQLLAELAPTLQKLSISATYPFSSIHLDQCRSLRSLHFRFLTDPVVLRRTLEACKGNLRELEISNEVLDGDVVNAIAENCGGLQKLRMHYAQVTGVLRHVWETIGPTLEDLSLDMRILDYEDRHELIGEIATHCTNVTSLGYTGINVEPLVLLCEKFGRQLQSLQIERYVSALSDAQVIGRILDASPDVRVDAWHGLQELESLADCRDCLRAVGITDEDRGDAKEAGNSVPSLEKLRIFVHGNQGSEDFLSNFFSTPKLALKSISIVIMNYKPLVADDNPLDVLATVVTGLEVLFVSAERIGTTVFRQIAGASKLLKSVSVLCGEGPEDEKDAEDAAVSFVEDFAQCADLEKLELENESLPGKSTKIAKASAAFSAKAIDVFIGGRQYGL